jgi:predicted outer membrane repeat protein
MRRSNWLHELRASLGHSKKSCARSAKWRPTAARRPKFEPLEERNLLALLTVNSALDNNTPNDGLVTLREAIFVANTDTMTDLGQSGSGADTIVFDPAVFGTQKTLALSLGQMVISQPLTINGPGRDLLTIDGQNSSRIIDIGSSNVTVSSLTFTRGRATDAGGAIRALANETTIHDCIVQNSTAVNTGGGGLALAGSALVSDCIVRANNTTSGHGGGILAQSNNLLTLANSVVSGNSAGGAGGGIYSQADVKISNSTVSDNTAGTRGGGFARALLPSDRLVFQCSGRIAQQRAHYGK